MAFEHHWMLQQLQTWFRSHLGLVNLSEKRKLILAENYQGLQPKYKCILSRWQQRRCFRHRKRQWNWLAQVSCVYFHQTMLRLCTLWIQYIACGFDKELLILFPEALPIQSSLRSLNMVSLFLHLNMLLQIASSFPFSLIPTFCWWHDILENQLEQWELYAFDISYLLTRRFLFLLIRDFLNVVLFLHGQL